MWEKILQTPRSEKKSTPDRYFPAAHRGDHSAAHVHTVAHTHTAGCGGYSMKEVAACRSGFILKDCSLWEGAILEEGKTARRKEQQKGVVIDWPQHPFPISVTLLGVGNKGRKIENGRVKLSLGKSGLWWVDLEWKPSVQQSCSITPPFDCRENIRKSLWVKNWERSFSNYSHGQNRLDSRRLI